MKSKWLAVVVAAVVTLGARGAIVEIKQMNEMAGGLKKDTLVVFDIDNTILQSTQTLGSVQWADWNEKELIKKGMGADQANTQSSNEWVRINLKGGQETVEAVTPNIIRNLQARGIKVLALTARPTGIALKTVRDLPRFGLNFAKSWPNAQFKSPFQGAAYTSGVLFAGQKNSKGAVLLEFLRQNHYRPAAVRFVDDKQKYVLSVEQAMQQAGIPYVGYRYGGADYRVNHMSPALAAFATDYFRRNGIILSDAEARRKMGGMGRAALP